MQSSLPGKGAEVESGVAKGGCWSWDFLLWPRRPIISQSEDVAGECVALGGIDFDEFCNLRDFKEFDGFDGEPGEIDEAVRSSSRLISDMRCRQGGWSGTVREWSGDNFYGVRRE